MKKTITLIAAFLLITSSLFAQDFASLYKNLSPSVVTIMVKEHHAQASHTSRGVNMVSSEGLGSGVLINDQGDIWTAAHVVLLAEEVVVNFQSGEKVPAKVITTNATADVALIRLLWMPKEYKVAKIAPSSTVNIGDKVCIIGAPFGLERSLSVGYISGRHKEKGNRYAFSKSEYFQTDASINHGNSGGPMFNTKGEVVGIVSSILSQSGGFDGIGFVVTSDICKLHLEGDQPFWYGAEFQVISGELRSIFNLPQEMGLLVQKVAAGSPAALSGLKPGIYKSNIEGNELLTGGDIIIRIGEIKVEPAMDIDAVGEYLAGLKPNQTFTITVLRNGGEVKLIGVVPSK
ncbi:MAG: S1C family serine protease [Salibacteraceae bacterium]